MKNARCHSDKSKEQSRKETPASSPGGAPAEAVLLPVTQAQPVAGDISEAGPVNAGCRDDGSATRLSREAANLLELLSRQSMWIPP
jgi:hypothetical protein